MNLFKLIIFILFPIFLFGQKKAAQKLLSSFDSMMIAGQNLLKSNDFINAHKQFLEVDSFVLKHYGNISKKYQEVCYYRAHSANKLGDVEQALSYYKKTLELSKLYNDTLSVPYENSLDELSKLLTYRGEFKPAELLMIELLDLRSHKHGMLNQKTAMAFYSLSILNAKKENFELATKYAKECLSIREDVFGKNSMEYAITAYHLVKLYFVQNYYDSTFYYLNENLDILRALHKTNTSIYADCLLELAFLMKEQNADYEKAEALFIESYEIYQKEPKLKAKPSYALFLKSLGIHYKSIGNFNRALMHLYEAKEATKLNFGTQNWDYYSLLYTIGNVYCEQKNFTAAKEMYEFILNSNELSTEDREINFPYVKGAMINLGDMTGEPIPESYAKDIMEKARSKETTTYSLTMALLQNSLWLFNNHRYSEAIESDLEALSLVNGTFSPESDLYNTIYFNLSSDYLKLNQLDSSRKYFLLNYHSTKKKLLNSFEYMADSEIHLLTQKMLQYAPKLIGNQVYDFKNYAGFIYDDALLYKGILQYARIIKNKLINKDPSAKELFANYKSGKRLLANEYTKPLADQKNIAGLEEKANALERALNKHVKGIEKLLDQVSWKQVHSKLKTGEAAVEFMRMNVGRDSHLADSFWYVALLIRPELSEPEFILLCNEKELSNLIVGDAKRRMEYVLQLYVPENKGVKPTKSLANLIWKPIEPFLNQVKTIYYSPAGLLHRINFGPIVQSKSKRMLMDDYQFILLTSTRELVMNPNVPNSISNECVFFGGIDYENEVDTNMILASNVQVKIPEDITRGSHSFYSNDPRLRVDKWNTLPGAKVEIDKIHSIVSKTNFKIKSVYGKDASEKVFKSLGRSAEKTTSPTIIHISTHGFFFSNPKDIHTSNKVSSENGPVFMNATDPMIRSGLILAGANYAWLNGRPMIKEEDDGILTSYEISQMDLSNTELVVLSACETGLGDIESTEGVYGLQRAFKIAGVQNVLMSLWQVPDKQTTELMELFYKNRFHNKMSIRAALKAAQQTLQNKGLEAYYWAGFVLME